MEKFSELREILNNEIARGKKVTREDKKILSEGDAHWQTYGRPAADLGSYDHYFRKLLLKALGEKKDTKVTFSDLVENKLQRKKERKLESGKKEPVYFLDLMGPGVSGFEKGESVQRVGFELVDPRNHYHFSQEPIDAIAESIPKVLQQIEHVIEGNIFDFSDWEKIRDYMNQYGISGFDIITCRPRHPFDLDNLTYDQSKQQSFAYSHPQEYLYVFFKLLQRSYGLLARGGEIYTQMPKLNMELERYQMFLEQFQDVMKDRRIVNDMIVYRHSSEDKPSLYALRIKKSQHAPERMENITWKS